MCRLAPCLLLAGIAAACADPYRPPAGDLEPPVVVGSDPAAGAIDVGRRPELRVEFSEPIDPATLGTASIVLLGPTSRIEGEVRAEERAAVFVPAADLREGTAFRLVARRTVRDLAGVPLAGDEGPGTDATIAFRTAAVAPTVTAVTPAHGTTAVAFEPPTPVAIRFAEPMDPATVDGRTVVVRDLHGPVPGAVTLDAASTTATFTPAGPWREGRAYAVEVAAACADRSGIPLAAPTHAIFVTATDAPTLTPLEAGGAPPAIDGFVARFEASEALDGATVQPWNFTVTPPAAFRVAWVPASRFVEVAFTETLHSSVAYAVTAGTAIADDDGNALAAPATFRFTTPATPDNNPPGPIVLTASSLRRATLRLAWNAPGDDVETGAAKGAATAYEVRRSPLPIRTLADFERGAPVPAVPPTPGAAGTAETLDLAVNLYEPWHYAVLAVDDAGNPSLSNDLLAGIALADDHAAGAAANGALGSAVLVVDLDVDGLPELIAGAAGEARVAIFAGTPAGLALAAPAAVLAGPSGSRFGAALAAGDADADGDLDLLVGAPAEDAERGAAYLFRSDAGLPGGEAVAVFRGATIRDRLGAAVALAELDGDGAAETIVGVPGGGAENQGQVRIAAGVVGGTPDPATAIVRTGAAPGESYGSALAVADLDADGTPDLVIGAPGADVAGTDTGRVEVRLAAGARTLPGPVGGGFFGAALAVGDVDGDGTADLVVGAPLTAGEDDEGFVTPAAGAAHLYPGPLADGAAPLWSARGVAAEGHLGAAVAIAGPLLDDAAGGIVAGAPGAPNASGARPGTVRLYHVSAARAVVENGVIAGPEPFDGFGGCVASAGDLDGDGLDDLAVGAPLADGAASAAGGVHLFR